MKSLFTQIERKYKSFSSPEFFFVSDALQKRPYKDLIEQVRACFLVEEDTDPNDDVSFGYLLSAKYHNGAENSPQWLLRLSMVGPYAMLLRFSDTKSIPTLISYTQSAQSELEEYLLNTLSLYGICLMDRQTLMQSVPMILFNAEPERTYVYHSLFTDTDILPWEVVT